MALDDTQKLYFRGLKAFVKINERWLREHSAPKLIDAGVRYDPTPTATEMWRIIPVVLESKHGDAEDIVAWAAAEALVAGRKANVGLKTVKGRVTVVLVVDGRELTAEELVKGAR